VDSCGTDCNQRGYRRARRVGDCENEDELKFGTAIVLTVLGSAAAGAVAVVTRGKPDGLRLLASGLAFGVPWVVHAATRSPDCSVLVLFDTHGPAAGNVKLVAALLREQNVSAVIHAGDVADSADLYGPWFDVPFREVVARWPFYVASGNHDDATEFASRFPALPVRLICGSAEIYFLPWGADQHDIDWVASKVRDSSAPTKILVSHRPVWPVEGGGAALRGMLLPILPYFQLVIAGHEHVFSDSEHVIGGTPVRQIIDVSGPKKYDCPAAPVLSCTAGQTAYWRLDFYDNEIKATRRVVG
jgi:predicted phosphodiesterase